MKRVSVGVLKNGFRFYTQFDPRSHVSGIGVKVGSMHDPPSLRGMAHLTEHVVCSFSREEELKLEEYVCGPEEDINIRVDRSSTFYGHNLLLRREYALEFFSIFAKAVRDPSVNKSVLDKERAAVLNEYFLNGIDSVKDVIDDLMHGAMYGRNPARNRVDCEPDELQKITCGALKDFIRQFYVPNNMFAVILGVPFQKVKRMMEEYFGNMRPLELPPFSYGADESRPVLQNIKRIEIERAGIHQYHVAIGFPTNPFGHKDDEALDVLARIWAWRLRNALRFQNQKWGWGAYRALTFAPRSFAHGMIYAWFATPSKEFAEFGAEKMIAECKSLREEWVLNDELVAMSNKLYNKYLDAFNNAPEQLAEMIIESACNGDEEMKRLNSYLGRLARVGKKSLLRVANEYFSPSGYVHLIVKPA